MLTIYTVAFQGQRQQAHNLRSKARAADFVGKLLAFAEEPVEGFDTMVTRGTLLEAVAHRLWKHRRDVIEEAPDWLMYVHPTQEHWTAPDVAEDVDAYVQSNSNSSIMIYPLRMAVRGRAAREWYSILEFMGARGVVFQAAMREILKSNMFTVQVDYTGAKQDVAKAPGPTTASSKACCGGASKAATTEVIKPVEAE